MDDGYKYSMRVSGTGDGTSGIFIWGAQLETGDIATDYIPTTTAAVSVGITADIPRLDYTGGGCPSLLLEPQRTNLALFSEQFDNAAWTKVRSTITANNTTSPAGYLGADLLVADTSTNDHFILRSATASISQTFSIFAKAGGYNFVFVGSDNVNDRGVFFNLTNGTISQNTSTLTAKIEDYGNGWYRCAVSSASWPQAFALVATSANGTALVHTGDGTSGVFTWGAQLEAGSYVSSYIPSLGSSVTRLADVASKTGISSLIGQTEGTLYCEFFYNEQNTIPIGNDKSVMRVESGGGYANEIAILYYGNEGGGFGKTIQAVINSGGVLQSAMSSPQTMATGYVKVALAYKANDFALAVNGVVVATDNSGSVPTCANFSLNEATRFQSDINPKQAALYTTRLSNAELASLTSL
jgi:hypothetical protein